MSAIQNKDVAVVPAGAGRRSVRHRLIDAQRRWPILQVVALIAVWIYGVQSLEGLGTWESIKTILVLASLAGLVSLGQTLVILIGGFDLSIPGFMIASAYIVTTIKTQHGLPFVVALALAVAVCAAFGAAAGQICHRFKVQPLVITLGMGAIVLGLVQAQVKNQPVGIAPSWVSQLTSPGSTTFGIDVPPVVLIWVVVIVLAALFLHRTVPGRRLMAAGANPTAADYSLIRTRRTWTLVFAFSGAVSALVALLVTGFSGALDTSVANPYLFQSIVAVIIGGTIFGGPGDYSRTVLGALFLTVVNVVLTGNGAPASYQNVLYGAILLIAVALYGRERKIRDRV